MDVQVYIYIYVFLYIYIYYIYIYISKCFHLRSSIGHDKNDEYHWTPPILDPFEGSGQLPSESHSPFGTEGSEGAIAGRCTAVV